MGSTFYGHVYSLAVCSEQAVTALACDRACAVSGRQQHAYPVAALTGMASGHLHVRDSL